MDQIKPVARSSVPTEPDRLVARGHAVGDFLEAWAWEVLEEADGHLRISAHLPDHLRNRHGQLFGGFTPTYVDLVTLFTVRSRAQRASAPGSRWLATVNMRIDYYAPIVGPRFIIDTRRETQRGRTHVVLTRFYQGDQLAVLAAATMREVDLDRQSGDT